MRFSRTIPLLIWVVAGLGMCGRAQAALLMEQPYGLSRVLNPTGHVAVYFARICAATSLRLRRCAPGELGSVIARYNGINGYDWIAVPLVPYLYAVDNAADAPERVSQDEVNRLRQQYHDDHLQILGEHLGEGGLIHRGWNQLAGASYNRRILSFRFNTTAAQDDAFIATMNAEPNRTRFHTLTSNCADFAAGVLDFYFPGVFRRHLLPDAGIVSPRQLAHELEGYAQRHPETGLRVSEIPQVPGYRRRSLRNKSVVGSFIVSGYVIPVAILAPYVAAGMGADFAIFGRYPLDLKDVQRIGPRNLRALEASGGSDARADAAIRQK